MANLLTSNQIPDKAAQDFYNRQTYLANAFMCSVDSFSLGSTSELPVLLIQNPAVTASAFPNGYQALFNNLRRVSCFADAVMFRFYKNPTVTSAGTPFTPINLRTSSSVTSIATVTTSPSISANGTKISTLACPAGWAASSALDMIIIDPGQSLLVTAQAQAGTPTVQLDFAFYQL